MNTTSTLNGLNQTSAGSSTSLNSQYYSQSLPSYTNGTGLTYSSSGTYTYSDPFVYQDHSPDYMVHRDAIQLVKDEISNMDIKSDELNKLVGSTNSDDFELAMNMLESQGAIYSSRILRTIRNQYPSLDSLKSILKEWYQKNYLNISNKYI